MNPLKVMWFHMTARVRLLHIWLVVQLGLHRKTPSRIRSKVVKIADWLEAAVMTACAEDKAKDAIDATYKKLQTTMAQVQNKEHHLKEEIDSIKGSFLQLLDLCGIKDADIPPLNEPVALRHSQQTLITSFGIMSKGVNGSAMTTPSRSRRHVRRDPASYADMLIEQLMANASPDSDTSPPSAEENNSRIFSSDSNIASDQLSTGLHIRPMALQFDNVPDQPSSNLQRPLSPASDSRCEWLEDRDNLATGPIQTLASMPRAATAPMLSPLGQEEVLNSSKSNQNATSGSTPELPASASSESLDIPYASLFDNFDNMNALGDIKPTNIPHSSAGSTLPQQGCFNFPLKYSHSYARELQRLETEMFSDLQLEPEAVPSPKSIPKVEGSDKSSKPIDKHYLSQEPLVVILPEKKPPQLKERVDEKQDYNLNNNYKPSLEDKSGVVESEEDSPKPPIPPRVPLVNSNSNTKVGHFVLASNSSKDIGSLWLQHNQKTESTSSSENMNLPSYMSWSYNDSPNMACPSNSLVSMSTGKVHVREKKGLSAYVTSPSGAHHPVTSASKRRKANDRSPMPVQHCTNVPHPMKSARQRLFCSPARTPTLPELSSQGDNLESCASSTLSSTPRSSRMERMKKTKRHSPAMRRLMQEKENNLLSPSKTQTSPRKPLSELYNIQLNESDPLTTSSNSLTPSSEAYAKSSETSPDMPLPSRAEDLLDRNTYYGDFTVDRDHKMDQLTPLQKKDLLSKGTQENFYTLKDPSSDEILVRQVEGAECSPRKPVFQVPLPNTRAPRSCRSKRQQTHALSGRQQSITRSSSSDGQCSSPSSNGLNKYSAKSRSSNRVSIQRRSSSSSGSCSSHPMASSTLIIESSLSPDKDETASVYTWSIEESSETCNLEKSFLRSQNAKKSNQKHFNSKTPRPPTNIGRDSSEISEFEEMMDDRSSFEITAMVSAIDKSCNGTTVLSGKQVDSFCDVSTTPLVLLNKDRKSSLPRTSTKSTISSRGIVAAAPNIMKKMSKSSGCSQSGGSSPSPPSSANQPSSHSAEFNKAKGSIQSIPSSSDEKSDGLDSHKICSNPLRFISASAPDLARPFFDADDENDASHSLEPSDTDSTPEIISPSSNFDDRGDIPGKSSSSGSSSCTAARCRPRVSGHAAWNEVTKNSIDATPNISTNRSHTDQAVGSAAQDLMDSILTDSPKSIDSSGIFAPYNSYNSPAESVGSHNGYSSTVSSSVPSSDSYYPVRQGIQAPPSTPPNQKLVLPTSQPSSEKSVFKRPFNPAPHVNHTAKSPVTRSQGVTATACASPRPMSVRSDPLANKSIFAVPPGVVTGPPKIQNKKSLVKKLKKFSTNFYKKNEKIQTLANL